MSTKTKGIIIYLLIAFGWSWIVWYLVLPAGLSAGSLLFQLAIVPGAFSPALAAFIVRKWITREGFSDAGLKFNLQKKWHYYLFALLFPFLVVLIIVALSIILGITQLNFIQENVSILPMLGLGLASHNFADWLALTIYLLCVALIATFISWGEEFGWRGYLQIRLLDTKPQLAAVATGLIWGIWHYPLMLRTQSFNEHPVPYILVFCVSTILISIVFGWLKFRTESIWAVSLAHSAINNIGGTLTKLLFKGIADPIFVGQLGILGWIPVGALCALIIIGNKLKIKLQFKTDNK